METDYLGYLLQRLREGVRRPQSDHMRRLRDEALEKAEGVIGRRTHMRLVDRGGFEPPTSSVRGRHSTRLNYRPVIAAKPVWVISPC